MQTLRQKLEILEKEKQEWEDKYWRVKSKNDEYEQKESMKRASFEAKEIAGKDYLSEENRKLWYLIRTLIKDEHLKPTEITNRMGEKIYIDIFEQRGFNERY